MSDSSTIQALIHLIDDPDDVIFAQVRNQLLQYGSDVLPYLEDSWLAYENGDLYFSRIEKVIKDIQFQETCEQLKEWQKGDRDLLEGTLIIAKHRYPHLDTKQVYTFFDHLSKKIWLEISNKFTAFEKVHVINRILYDSFEFNGDNKNYHCPFNSYINTVIEFKKGNPLSLAIVYSIIAQRVDLPIYGVNLPNHFILAYLDEDNCHQFSNIENHFGVLFYINAFANGCILDHEEVKSFLEQSNITPSKAYFEPCSNTAILKRMLNNLISCHSTSKKMEHVQELMLLRSILS